MRKHNTSHQTCKCLQSMEDLLGNLHAQNPHTAARSQIRTSPLVHNPHSLHTYDHNSFPSVTPEASRAGRGKPLHIRYRQRIHTHYPAFNTPTATEYSARRRGGRKNHGTNHKPLIICTYSYYYRFAYTNDAVTVKMSSEGEEEEDESAEEEKQT